MQHTYSTASDNNLEVRDAILGGSEVQNLNPKNDHKGSSLADPQLDYDSILVDEEAQDTNPPVLHLLRQQVLVGDEYQQLYA